MGNLPEAAAAYEAGLMHDSSNQALSDALAEVRSQLASRRAPPPGMPANPFANLLRPGFEQKLRANPKTASFPNDPVLMGKIREMGANPDRFLQDMISGGASDPRLMSAFSVLMGIDKDGDDMTDDMTDDIDAAPASTKPTPKPTSPAAVPTTKPSTKTAAVADEDEEEHIVTGASTKPAAKSESKVEATPQPEPKKVEEEEVVVDEELEREIRERTPQIETNPEAAEAEKNLGTSFYKKRDFEAATTHYEKAFELDRTNPVYKLNLSAVAFEQKNWPLTVERCDEALAVSNQFPKNRLSFNQLSKLYLRKGNALVKMNKFSDAIASFQRSLLEEKNTAASDAIRKATLAKKEFDDKAYLDPVKSEEAKNKGNDLFKEGKWAEAIDLYTEAIKRNPDNYKVYANRAACYMKTMQWDKGLNDCEACLKIDPKFVKAYIRKGKIQHFLKQYPQAIETFTQGLEVEPQNAELLEALQATRRAIYEANNSQSQDPQRMQESLKDPAVQAILADPQMNNILREMSENPESAAVQRYLQDPKIMAALDKLVAAGVVRMG